MQKRLRITVEGKVYDVTVEELGDNGQPGSLYPSIAGTGASTTVTTAAPLTAAHPPAATSAPSAPAQPGDEVSPLSGVVDSVEVAVGQTVNEGDKIVVIEAMKMKTQVHAHHGGTVTSIAVKPGDAVEAGRVLLSIG